MLQDELRGWEPVLNLGAGLQPWVSDDGLVVNVDHVVANRERALAVVADGHRLPFRAGSFNGVLAKDVLEHLADPLGALHELHAVSRAGALLLVQVPRAVPRAVWDDPTHVRGFTANAVRTALSLTGWELQSISRIGGFPGAGRLGLTRHLELIMKVPVIGHAFGLNWLVRARRT